MLVSIEYHEQERGKRDIRRERERAVRMDVQARGERAQAGKRKEQERRQQGDGYRAPASAGKRHKADHDVDQIEAAEKVRHPRILREHLRRGQARHGGRGQQGAGERGDGEISPLLRVRERARNQQGREIQQRLRYEN
jgi:hypothetical protein